MAPFDQVGDDMDFTFTEEQTLLRSSLAAYLADQYDFETRRRVVGAEPGWRPEVWKAFAQDLGILGALAPAEVGGSEGGPVEMMVIMEELGRALVAEPFLSTAVIAGGLLARAGGPVAATLLPQIVGGDVRAAFAFSEPHARYDWRDLTSTARKAGAGYVLDGRKAMVLGAPWASHLIVTARTGGAQRDSGGISTFVLDAAARGITRQDYATIDGGRASDVTFENVSVPAEALIGAEGEAAPLLERIIDEATVGLCAEAVGLMRAMHEQTVDYTKQRKQFGQPLGAFQVLRHRMVDMFIQLEQATSITYLAAIRLADEDPIARARAASAAKAQVGQAARFVGQQAIQLHGGMGLTDELAVGSYFKRATVIETQFGDTDHHLARYSNLSFGAAA
ncbi:MAG TPA: acyl-CoA dehydrogenase [Caulobacteraceae bacterium]|nr:acyl-CoA dehydrogenase [Caulobacteraceae bacterium]